MIGYHDKNGEPLNPEEWSTLFENKAYRRVAERRIGKTWISTVWVGLDLSMGFSREPLIFETMVFDTTDRPFADLYVSRYSTLDEALEGHDKAVAEFLSSNAD